MVIDSAGTLSLGSDHNSITLSFGTPPPSTECRLPIAHRRALSDSAVYAVVELLEEEAPHRNVQSYEDMQQWFQDAISKVQGSTHTTGTRARRRPKAWWDSEVAVALAARKLCCREHRHALSQGADEKEILVLWNQYLEAKRRMAGMVQQKMAAVNKRLLRTIKEAGRDAAKKFWRHVKARRRGASQASTSLQDPSTGVVYEAEQCTPYIEKYMAEKLQARQPPHAESRPIPADTPIPHCEHHTKGNRMSIKALVQHGCWVGQRAPSHTQGCRKADKADIAPGPQ
ncbi:hypothetical protein HPB52_014703 [Rhipicephalus sanguineus]|uniref:Uncharacterized protein n=1 Tax=Rhipicephalus sanguineus TaxID=34632 RepID=A0A9D4T6A5_RHISA|nr:hypothetical protein HPB52_014703 [Rhipicephalus sanguineus]